MYQQRDVGIVLCSILGEFGIGSGQLLAQSNSFDFDEVEDAPAERFRFQSSDFRSRTGRMSMDE